MDAAAKRILERKPEGSNPDSPRKQRARTEQEPPLMHLMQKMTDVEGKVDNMAEKVDGAIKMATEAKEDAKQVKITVETLREEQGRKGQVEWQTMIEGKVAAVEFKDTMPEEPVQDQMVHDKIKEIESKLASLKFRPVGTLRRTGQLEVPLGSLSSAIKAMVLEYSLREKGREAANLRREQRKKHGPFSSRTSPKAADLATSRRS